MKKITLSKAIVSLITGISVFNISGSIFADDSQNQSQAPNQEATDDDCSKELLLAYFPQVFVNETLKKFNVPKDHWSEISKDLANKDKEIVKTVEDKASKMDPNPLKDPQQRQAAVKIFRETLFEVFSETMKANGVTDEKQIQTMLDDIQQQKARRFAQCMGKQRQLQQQQQKDTSQSSVESDEVRQG